MKKNKQFKVVIIIGTRPEAIKMCPVIYELRKMSSKFKTVIIVTGQHKEMLTQILDVFKIEPHYNLNVMEKNQSLARLTEKVIPALEKIIIKVKPDIMLVQGDTTTSFVASLVAYYHKIMIAHVEAGLRTFKRYYPFPEEINRKLISVLCDIHFAPTQSAADNLIREGVPQGKINITGNTVIDALFYVLENFKNKWTGFQDNSNRQILLTAHRRENFGEPLRNICQAIKQLINQYKDIEVTYPVHKNLNVRGEISEQLSGLERVNLIEPLDYFKFVNLMNDSYLILTDSGGIQEEAPSLGKPVLVLRNETERPEAVAAGTVILVGTDTDSIVKEASIILDNEDVYFQMANAINPYGDGKASKRIVERILSNLN
ncbi:MAG: UDP-N-acetylglucosamine 2-epimerase (non-hydrolyzing) [Candidatus Cloacimonadota bacterium]|nr:UDP-N-acetylglucosamine 2-epimerase (non-hydrolyzing) [Candidatus Cloacimonadota bacterium]